MNDKQLFNEKIEFEECEIELDYDGDICTMSIDDDYYDALARSIVTISDIDNLIASLTRFSTFLKGLDDD